eukprot:7291801-Prymnesium_polylepis.4
MLAAGFDRLEPGPHGRKARRRRRVEIDERRRTVGLVDLAKEITRLGRLRKRSREVNGCGVR